MEKTNFLPFHRINIKNIIKGVIRLYFTDGLFCVFTVKYALRIKHKTGITYAKKGLIHRVYTK